MRPLRDRLGEAIRLSRLGDTRPVWVDLPEHTKEDYRVSADQLIELGPRLRYEVRAGE